MKKRFTAIALLAVMSLSPTAALADQTMGIIGGADGPTAILLTEPSRSDDTVQIYYNSEYLTPGIIINERTMLPFRDFLEAIGAEVDYNEMSGAVTAVRDGTTISFALDSDTIHIVNDEGEKDIAMDVKPTVIDGEVYTPVRFLGEAFAMQIGWSDYSRTALIADYEKYCEELWQNSPNLKKLMELDMLQPDNAVSGTDISFHFVDSVPQYDVEDSQLQIPGFNETLFDFSMRADSVTQGLNQSTDAVVNLTYKDADGTEVSLKDAGLSLIAVDNNFYIKTDILNQLAGLNPTTELAAQLSSPDNWYKISLEDYINLIADVTGSYIDFDEIQDLISKASDPRALLEQQLKSQTTLYGTGSVDTITETFHAASAIDKYIVIDELGENDYSIRFALNLDNLLTLISDILGEELSEDDKEEINEFISPDFEISLASRITDGITVTQDIAFNITIGLPDIERLTMKLDAKTTVDPSAEAADVTVPEEFFDLTELLNLLLEQNT